MQATAVRPEITKTIRMIILIFFPQCRENVQSSLSTGSTAPGADRGELSGRRSGLAKKPQFLRPHSSPFPSVCGGVDEGLASAIPAAKSHAPALGTGLRCRSPRGHCQLHPLLALLQGASDPQLRGMVKASVQAWLRALLWRREWERPQSTSWGLAHRYTPPIWQGVSHPLPAVPAQWTLTSSPSPSPGFSAAVASTLALRMARRKVLVPMARGYLLCSSDMVRSRTLPPPPSGGVH